MTRWWQWLKGLVLGDSEDEPASPQTKTAEERARFWVEFRAGQRIADERGRPRPERPLPATE